MTHSKLNILLIAAEVAPFAKVGGLADVAGGLPKALKALGHDVRVVMPAYKMIETNPAYQVQEVLPKFTVPIREGVRETAYVRQTFIPFHAESAAPKGKKSASPRAAEAETGSDIPVYLIGNPNSGSGKNAKIGYFQEATESRKVYAMEPDPYIFFGRAVLEMLTRLKPAWNPDILHCNDWHTGLIPVFASQFYQDKANIRDAASVFTIHNLAYQGTFDASHWPSTGLPDSLYDVNGLEFYGQWSFMKGGLLFADQVNTVSPRYSCEIQGLEYGCGLHGLLRTLDEENRLTGIINGLDYEEFNPATDPRIPANFSASKPAGKARCKAALQAELGLPAEKDRAVIGIVSRLADQKGLDLIHAIAEPMLELPVQFVLLGTGDPGYEKFFTELQARYPQQVHARIGFDMELAQRIYAGSDLFLMPSRFEPCGLGQMISLRYGTLPIVRATGGLADSVQDFDPEWQPDGNGFVFSAYHPQALLDTVRRAVEVYQDKTLRVGLVKRALSTDFSWTRSAERYIALFENAKAGRRL